VMDMLYHLPFRDWMEIDRGPAGPAPVEAETSDAGSGETR
jgi:beta-lactamase class C